MEFRPLGSNEIDAWLDHCGRVFAPVERAYFARHYHCDPWHDHRDILVAVENGRIVSAVRVFSRRVRIRGQEMAMGGIGEVATAPEGQGQGLAGTLLEMAMELMTGRGMVVSALFGTHSNYHRLGWRNVPQAMSVSPLPAVAAAAASDGGAAWHLSPLRDPAVLPELAELHRVYNRDHDGLVVRDDPRYWQEWFMADTAEKWLARDDTGQLVAYLVAQQRNDAAGVPDRLVVRDFASLVPAVEVFVPLLGDLVASLPDGAEIPRVKYPACIAGGLPVSETVGDAALMYRLLHPFRVGDLRVESTEDLVALLQDADRIPGRAMVFWYLDGF